MKITDDPAFQKAVSTAHAHIPIQKTVHREPPGFVIAEDAGRFAVFGADAWEKPTSTPMLPWSPPKGRRVARVNLDGGVSLLDVD